jgi:endonuclease YncB( thermonuclease family)
MKNLWCFKNNIQKQLKVSNNNQLTLDYINKYKQYNYYNTPSSLIENSSHYVRFIDIYDADTLTCIVELRPGLFQKITIRLNRIDACEMTSKNQIAKDFAIRARNRVISYLTLNKIEVQNNMTRSQIRELLAKDVYIIYVKFNAQDKYGRTLGDVYLTENSESVSTLLLNEKLVLSYNGGKRLDEIEQVNILTHHE